VFVLLIQRYAKTQDQVIPLNPDGTCLLGFTLERKCEYKRGFVGSDKINNELVGFERLLKNFPLLFFNLLNSKPFKEFLGLYDDLLKKAVIDHKLCSIILLSSMKNKSPQLLTFLSEHKFDRLIWYQKKDLLKQFFNNSIFLPQGAPIFSFNNTLDVSGNLIRLYFLPYYIYYNLSNYNVKKCLTKEDYKTEEKEINKFRCLFEKELDPKCLFRRDPIITEILSNPKLNIAKLTDVLSALELLEGRKLTDFSSILKEKYFCDSEQVKQCNDFKEEGYKDMPGSIYLCLWKR
jgi:hypothetical protein